MAGPLPPTPSEVFKLQLQWSDAGDNLINSNLFFSYTGGPATAADLHSLLVAAASVWTTYMVPLYAPAAELVSAIATDLSVAGGAVGESNWALVGTRTGSTLPIGVTALFNHHITRAYRGGKPRNYLPLGTASDLGGAMNWSSGAQAAFISGFDNFISHFLLLTEASVSPQAHVSVSYYNGFTNESYGTPLKYRRVPTRRAIPVVDVINTTTLNPIYGSQRRRYRA